MRVPRLELRMPPHASDQAVDLARALSLTRTAASVLAARGLLETARVLAETTGKRRDRSWAYRRWLDVLCAGTESDPERPGVQ